MSFLESQLERVTASCQTVESYNSRIDSIQDAMAATETRVAAELSVDGKDAADAERRAKREKKLAARAKPGAGKSGASQAKS